MFATVYNSENRKFALVITLKCQGEKSFRIIAEDYSKPNSEYAKRDILVNGERTIYLSFPVTPQFLTLQVFNTKDAQDKNFTVTLQEDDLKTFNVWLDAETNDFLKLAIPFCQVCGFQNGQPQGKVYTTDNQQFTIKYFDIIRDQKSGKQLSTPARIGHQTGIIEVSKMRFDHYTIPMRLIILLHEFSHKYKNPKIGLQINDEVGADINALYIYLGLGFSKIDAICVFANVFLKAQTKGNIERMRKIMDYIQKFENGEFAKPLYNPEYAK
jgi:hypothetical protein